MKLKINELSKSLNSKMILKNISIEATKGELVVIAGPNGSGKSNIADALKWAMGEQSMKSIRGKKAEDILDELFALDDSKNSVMIFGHNPTFTSFANQFLDEKIDWLPTSGVVSISFDTHMWVNLPMAKIKTGFVVFPKGL